MIWGDPCSPSFCAGWRDRRLMLLEASMFSLDLVHLIPILPAVVLVFVYQQQISLLSIQFSMKWHLTCDVLLCPYKGVHSFSAGFVLFLVTALYILQSSKEKLARLDFLLSYLFLLSWYAPVSMRKYWPFAHTFLACDLILWRYYVIIQIFEGECGGD